MTLEATTKIYVRSHILPLSRIYRTYLLSLRLHRLKLQLSTDTLFVVVKSLMGNTCAQIFNDGEYMYIHTIKSKNEAGHGLQNFTEDVGIPAVIMRHNAEKKLVTTLN